MLKFLEKSVAVISRYLVYGCEWNLIGKNVKKLQ